MENASIITKVQKLLALAKSDNAHEAANAARMANDLLDKHRLSMADVESADSDADPMSVWPQVVYSTLRIVEWKMYMCCTIAGFYGCAAVSSISKQNGRRRTSVVIVGRRSDCEIAAYMIDYLTRECERLCKLEAYGRGHSYSQSYCMGFVLGVHEQLRRSREALHATSEALVKLDNRHEESQAYLAKICPDLKKAKDSKAQYRADGYEHGKQRGETIQLRAGLSGQGPAPCALT